MNKPSPHGIALIDKPQGVSSHDVVARLRYHLGTKKVGHAGTLDPMATGLLILGVGQGTKLLTYAVGLSKTYQATIRLGVHTVTDDAEGEYIGQPASQAQLDAIDDAAIAAAVRRLSGPIMQVPSAVSAIKVNGVRSYARVRGGEDVKLKARPVSISRFDVQPLVRVHEPHGSFIDVEAVIDCSSGTYIRALARDLGDILGSGGHLTSLRRTRVGEWEVASAQPLPQRDSPRASEDEDHAIRLGSLSECAARILPLHPVTADEARALRFGQWISKPEQGEYPAAAIHPPTKELVAIVDSARGGALKPSLVFPAQ